MGKHCKSRRTGTSARLNRALAIGALAGSTVGLGAFAAFNAPAASADDGVGAVANANDGGVAGPAPGATPAFAPQILTRNNTILGTNGNGNSTQLGLVNGNNLNGQLAVPIFSVNTGAGTNAAPPLGGAAVGGLGTSAATTLGVPIGGLALSTTLGLSPAISAGVGIGAVAPGTGTGGAATGGFTQGAPATGGSAFFAGTSRSGNGYGGGAVGGSASSSAVGLAGGNYASNTSTVNSSSNNGNQSSNSVG
jgi:hypothetical protein